MATSSSPSSVTSTPPAAEGTSGSSEAVAPGRGGRRLRHMVAPASEFPVGARKILKIGGREIGVFHTSAGLFALRSSCPHQGAPLCLGVVTGTTLPSMPGEYIWGKDGEVLRCPWHGWEFDMRTGVGLYDPYRHERVATYEVQIDGDDVVLFA